MGVSKFLKQIVTPKEEHYHDDDIISDDPNHFIYGVTSNAVTQFAILFAAAVHDIDHKGLENTDLAKMNPKIASKFKNRCIAEQHSVETAFNILMKDEFKELQQAIFADDEELKRVRQIVTNSVLATDFDDEQNKAFRDQRWANAFRNSRADDSYTANLKATAVLEVLLQVADISYATQHWKVFQKWNEQHFREQMMAFDAGRQSQDPSDSWYEQVLSFLDTDVIPVAQKLKECGIVGVASDECLGFASDNRREWAQKGKDLVQAMAERYQKRKEMEIAGFTAEEVGNFSHKELEFIIKKLVEKGRSNGTKKVDSVKGQNDAAQAWMDALEIYEQAPAASELSDRSIIFPVYSGVYAWLKGGKIDPSVVDNFEQNLAHKFVRESKLHDVGSVHSMRALAMLCEVTARAGDYKNAFNFLAVIKSMYEPEKHSLKLDEIYGTDRVAHAFAQSATWYEQMGDHDKALETCENAMKNLLPALDPTNTLGIFEFLLPILRVLKSQGQTERCYLLFSRHVDKAFREFHGEDEFTPTKSLHKPMLWLFGMCHDPDGFEEFDEVVRWLSHDDNGIPSDFLDTIMAQTTWAPTSMAAELCLLVANRLLRENKDEEGNLKKVAAKGLRLARLADSKIKDKDGNVKLHIANGMNESVLEALEELASRLNVFLQTEEKTTGKSCLDVKLPPSYVVPPKRASNVLLSGLTS